jgi:hypothetical protein
MSTGKGKPVLAFDIATMTPDFVVAAAREITETPTYFPGKDYPDREVWLAKRHTKLPPPVYVYRHPLPDEKGRQPKREPLKLGINNAKRMASRDAFNRGENSNPKHCRGKSIVAYRHAYYRREAA